MRAFMSFQQCLMAFAFLAALASGANAALVGNDPNEAGGFHQPSDGHNVLSIQLQNPIPQTGILDSFTFASGPELGGFTGPLIFHALVFRSTGTLNEYSVIFDSGDFDGGLFDGVFALPITSVTVEPGDLVGHWGRGIAYNNTSAEDTWFNNGEEFNTPLPAGTFLAPGPSYDNLTGGGGAGTREYAIAFNLVPRPSVPGDTNSDGDVDLVDLNNVRNNFGATGAPGLPGDAIPFDGIVDLADLNAVRNNFGAVGAQAVPEPSTIVMNALGALAIVAFCRRRRKSAP